MRLDGRIGGASSRAEGAPARERWGGLRCLDIRDTPHTRRISRRAKGVTCSSKAKRCSRNTLSHFDSRVSLPKFCQSFSGWLIAPFGVSSGNRRWCAWVCAETFFQAGQRRTLEGSGRGLVCLDVRDTPHTRSFFRRTKGAPWRAAGRMFLSSQGPRKNRFPWGHGASGCGWVWMCVWGCVDGCG